MENEIENDNADHAKDLDDSTSGGGLEVGGGIFRSILRRVGQLAGKASLGQLPHKLPLKQVVNTAERLGDLIEIGDQIGKQRPRTHTHNQKQHQHDRGSHDSTHSHDESNKPSNSRIARGMVHGAHAISGFVKSSVLGGVLFYTYDYLQDIEKLAAATNDDGSSCSSGGNYVSTVWIGTSASTVGAIGR